VDAVSTGAGVRGTVPDPARVRTAVLKVGSSLIVDTASGQARDAWMADMADTVARRLRSGGTRVLIVSSGAVALGRGALGLKPGKLRLEEKQAAAAAGQTLLMAAWAKAFAPHGLPVAQALLTPDDTERRRRWLNARSTLDTLLECGAIPVVNENDTVATEELRYGDNDRLAARVAQMVAADLLVLFSDIDGLYDADPRTHPAARHIGSVSAITPQIEAMAGGANTVAGLGSGGMRTKIDAARIAMGAGCHTAITDGREPGALARLLDGGRATWFAPEADPQTARRAWLAHQLRPAGAYVVDAGAARALRAGASLLPVGVTAVEGSFERGDAVEVLGPERERLATGITAYSSADAAMIRGRRSEETEAILGYSGRPALVHRDDLVRGPD
jgi:glutamate 5-kinase